MPPRLRDVTIRQLRALTALAAGGSVTAASNQLGLTQPAVTQQLRQLQDLAGIPLVQRTREGMLLTNAGREVAALAERIEAAIGTCERSLEIMIGRVGGSVSICAVSTAKYFIPRAVAAFAKNHPGIDIRITIGNREQIHQAMRGYDFDFAVMGRPPAEIESEAHMIGDHPHVIVAPANHRLAKRSGITVADLAEEMFLTRESGSGTRTLMEALFEMTELRPKIGMEMSSNETIKQGVIAGLGLAFISAHTVATELKYRQLVALDIVGLPVTRQWFTVRRRDKILLPPAQAMLDFLKSECATFLPTISKSRRPR